MTVYEPFLFAKPRPQAEARLPARYVADNRYLACDHRWEPTGAKAPKGQRAERCVHCGTPRVALAEAT